MRNHNLGRRKLAKHFTDDEKRDICLSWENSGQTKIDFCKAAGVSKSALYRWLNQFEMQIDKKPMFSPLILKSSHEAETKEPIKLEISLPNQTILSVFMQKPILISFIKELSNAATIIR